MTKKTVQTTYSTLKAKRPGWAEKANVLGGALEAVVASVGPLDFDDKRMVMRWSCDALGISVKNLPLQD